jgi:predicted Fe-Mo cluster-binding NifX family protein
MTKNAEPYYEQVFLLGLFFANMIIEEYVLKVFALRIAIPCASNEGLNSYVSEHFGRAEYYIFVDVEKGDILSANVLKLPFHEHGPGDIPKFVKEHGGEIVIAYRMGMRAIEHFESLGIKVILGAKGKVIDVINDYLRGSLELERIERRNCGNKKECCKSTEIGYYDGLEEPES